MKSSKGLQVAMIVLHIVCTWQMMASMSLLFSISNSPWLSGTSQIFAMVGFSNDPYRAFTRIEGSERQCVVGEACLQDMCHIWRQQDVKLFGWMPSIDDRTAQCDETFAHFLSRLHKDKMFVAAFAVAVLSTFFASVLLITILLLKEKQQWYERDYDDLELDFSKRWDQPDSVSHGPKWLPIFLYILLTLCAAALFTIWTNYMLRFDTKSSIKFGYALESTTTVLYFMTLFIGGIVLWKEIFTAY